MFTPMTSVNGLGLVINPNTQTEQLTVDDLFTRSNNQLQFDDMTIIQAKKEYEKLLNTNKTQEERLKAFRDINDVDHFENIVSKYESNCCICLDNGQETLITTSCCKTKICGSCLEEYSKRSQTLNCPNCRAKNIGFNVIEKEKSRSLAERVLKAIEKPPTQMKTLKKKKMKRKHKGKNSPIIIFNQSKPFKIIDNWYECKLCNYGKDIIVEKEEMYGHFVLNHCKLVFE